MKAQTVLLVGIALGCIAACSGKNNGGGFGGGFTGDGGLVLDDGSGGQDSTIGASSGPASGSGGGSGCPATCTVDSDCQGTCSAPPSGSFNCCDVQSATCFVSTSTCPVMDSGTVE
jgi:hypothetical protein